MNNTKGLLLNWKALLLIVAVAGVVFIGGWECPFLEAVGIPCPGCGMTRAFLAAAQCDFDKAFFYHPMWLLTLIFGIIAGVLFYKQKTKLFRAVVLSWGLLMLVCYGYRLVMVFPYTSEFTHDSHSIVFKTP